MAKLKSEHTLLLVPLALIVGVLLLTALFVLLYVKSSKPVSLAATIPNDTYFSSQWALAKIRSTDAWDLTTGSSAQKIAVLSTGVDTSHPDLIENLIPGYNAVSPGSSYGDLSGQGTMMSGIIGAVGNNAKMVTGVNWKVSILPVRVCDKTCGIDKVAEGIRWAADADADVIVVGAAFESSSTVLESAVNYALSGGSLVVAAAGDVATKPVHYPAAYPSVVAVGASDSADAVASFTSKGAALDVVAPGVSITNTWPGSQISTGSGTHLAAAHAGGVLGLMLAAGVPATQAVGFLQQSAVDLGTAGFDNTSGWGRIDACGALNAAGRTCPVGSGTPSPAPSTDPNADTDGDGCTDAQELGTNPAHGGDRDPNKEWDFFDVPVPSIEPGQTGGVKNRAVSLQDVGAIMRYVGTRDGGAANSHGLFYNSDLNGNGIPDGREYDRTASSDPSKPWRSGPPDGAVSLQDASVALSQVGHNCSGS